MRYMRYRNTFGTEGSYTNPRRRHRNPSFDLDLDHWFKEGGIMDAAVIGASLVGAEQLSTGINLGPTVENAAAPAGNLGKAVIDGGVRVGLGIAGGALLSAMGQKRFGRDVALGGVLAGVLKAGAELKVPFLTPGSIIIGHHPAPSIPQRVTGTTTPTDVRASTPIPPVYSL